MIASRLAHILFQNVSLDTEASSVVIKILTQNYVKMKKLKLKLGLSLVGNILIRTDDAFSIKRNLLK